MKRYEILENEILLRDVIVLPIKWLLAISVRTSIYSLYPIGIPLIFKIKKGIINKRIGTKKVVRGEIN